MGCEDDLSALFFSVLFLFVCILLVTQVFKIISNYFASTDIKNLTEGIMYLKILFDLHQLFLFCYF